MFASAAREDTEFLGGVRIPVRVLDQVAGNGHAGELSSVRDPGKARVVHVVGVEGAFVVVEVGDFERGDRDDLSTLRWTTMPAPLIEFPADDPERALRFWRRLLEVELAPRNAEQGSGWEADREGLRIGVHERGAGPGDTGSLPYFTVDDMTASLELVRDLGGSVVHPGERWAICRDSEGSPFALSRPGG